jgi:hypothetical protein
MWNEKKYSWKLLNRDSDTLILHLSTTGYME